MSEHTFMPSYRQTLEEMPIRRSEVLRYAGCDSSYDSPLVDQCIQEMLPSLRYDVCWTEFPVKLEGCRVDLGFSSFSSQSAMRFLCGCDRAIVFCATVGIHPDRMVAKYSRLSPAKSLFMQALGAERIEELCNAFCRKQEERLALQGLTLRHRFSPGYGDIPLGLQKDIFSVLDVSKNIGVTLTDSLLMTPTKSVTAIAGICSGDGSDDGCGAGHDNGSCAGSPAGSHAGCDECGLKDCAFRKKRSLLDQE